MVVVGDGCRALGKVADIWLPWDSVQNGEVDEEMMRSGKVPEFRYEEHDEQYDDDEFIVDWDTNELDDVVDDIVTSRTKVFGSTTMSAFAEEDIVDGILGLRHKEDDMLWSSDDEDEDALQNYYARARLSRNSLPQTPPCAGAFSTGCTTVLVCTQFHLAISISKPVCSSHFMETLLYDHQRKVQFGHKILHSLAYFAFQDSWFPKDHRIQISRTNSHRLTFMMQFVDSNHPANAVAGSERESFIVGENLNQDTSAPSRQSEGTENSVHVDGGLASVAKMLLEECLKACNGMPFKGWVAMWHAVINLKLLMPWVKDKLTACVLFTDMLYVLSVLSALYMCYSQSEVIDRPSSEFCMTENLRWLLLRLRLQWLRLEGVAERLKLRCSRLVGFF
uniref:Uncharacterized protein n=1 Tax=Aegilops tauschii TaxID=37682 RepID=M8BA36_AEGTA